jgi:DNA topoisomerase-1
MAKNLVIVESPAKAKTIEGYLGKEFVVKASMGHIRDLEKGNDAIDIKAGFRPHYVVSEGKEKVVQELKKLVNTAETVYLATDEDREGEAIAWHLFEELGLHKKNTKRFVYHEVTKNAILKAIQSPRDIDYNLVNAQQARRVLDRLVGFELSPILWRKIKPALSAGRVQSVAVRLIVEREKEIDAFESSYNFRITGDFLNEPEAARAFMAELPRRIETAELAEAFLQSCKGAEYSVLGLETKPGKKSPAPPFTTSTLQQEASRKLGFAIDRTMRIAQQLYEAGHITYMRTDSVNLSEMALNLAQNEITSTYGPEYAVTRRYHTKSSNAQEAHEAIRPTDFAKKSLDLGRDEQRLYELIWKRAIASQMADAQIEKTIATIGISTNKETLQATGEIIRFEGFLKVYTESQDEDQDQEDNKRLPPLRTGQKVWCEQLIAAQKFAKPAARYTEASLVKKLEELGIGRPSTYAPTISTIQKREYVVKENRDGRQRSVLIFTLSGDILRKEEKTETYGAEKSKLFPTDIGIVVNDFLVKYFGNIVDYNFTASVEEEFDQIARGEKEWTNMLQSFYTPFHQDVEKILGEPGVKASTARLLGHDPATDLPVFATITRYGPAIQIGETGGNSPVRFASMQNGQSITSISLEEALALFRLPRILGEYQGMEVKVGQGKFGPYVLHNKEFTSLTAQDDPYSVTLERAIELIEAKKEAARNRIIREFSTHPDIKVLNGRYGPYIAVGKQNVKIPKGYIPQDLTAEQCLEFAQQQAPAKEKESAVSAKAPAKSKAGTVTTTGSKSGSTKQAKATKKAAGTTKKTAK